MNLNRLILLVGILSGSVGMLASRAAEPDPVPPADSAIPAKPLFSRHIVPLFSRLGCNAGMCHGAVQGKNGFRLSLFGAEPQKDQEGLVREFAGRRLNPLDPQKSLLLLKASGQLPHQGGVRTKVGSQYYQMLHRWIVQGAKLDEIAKSKVKSLRVAPQQRVMKKGEKLQLKVQATFADGSVEDVTWLSTFEAVHKDVAVVDEKGQVEAKEVGSTALIVRYSAKPVVAMVTVPRTGSESFPKTPENNFIDRHIFTKLREMNIHPSDLCDDATFLRRVCLDITGALPEPKEVRKFLADKSSDKRVKKIDELLQRRGYSALWATKFCDILKASEFNANFGFVEAAENRRFYEWVRGRLQENLPYDQFVERILLATSREGRPLEDWLQETIAFAEEHAKEDYHLTTYGKRHTLDLYWQGKEATGLKGAMQIGHAFLGLRLECAQCHRHPHDIWQQDDLLSFANFFMRVRGARYPNTKELPAKFAAMVKDKKAAKKFRDQANKLNKQLRNKKLSKSEIEKLRQEIKELQIKASILSNGPKRFGTEIKLTKGSSFASVTSPLGTQRSDQFRLLGEANPVKIGEGEDPRQVVMAWLRQKDNPFFARAIVNRVWAHYFGRGLVDPPDHLSPLNPPTHPKLLKELADEFVKHKYDLKWLHKTITESRTYQLSSKANATNSMDSSHYARFYLRRLPAEILVDAINHATGAEETYPIKLYLPPDSKALEVAGTIRSGNEVASVAFAFKIFGRPLRNPQVQCDCERDATATIAQTLYIANHPKVRAKIADPKGRIIQIMKRFSDEGERIDELYLWSVSRLPTAVERETCLNYVRESPTPKRGLEDVLWSLINTREFILNH